MGYKETETMDRLYLELSQFTTATTAKELKLYETIRDLAEALGREVLRDGPECYSESNEALTKHAVTIKAAMGK